MVNRTTFLRGKHSTLELPGFASYIMFVQHPFLNVGAFGCNYHRRRDNTRFMVLSISYIVELRFIGEGNQRKPPTYRKSVITFIR